MFLDDYYQQDGECIRVSAEQGSRFAKQVAGDFNPIHDAGARRFCVPGDLLCALVLRTYGLRRDMTFRFRELVGADVALRFRERDDGSIAVTDAADKVCLEVERSGPVMAPPDAVASFIRSYAAFSGENFPHVLQPLLEQHGVMFNPDRPLVMYDSMGFVLDDAAGGEPSAELTEARLDVGAKRADALLHFAIRVAGEHVGHGSKRLVIGGLRPYDAERMQQVIDEYEERRRNLGGD